MFSTLNYSFRMKQVSQSDDINVVAMGPTEFAPKHANPTSANTVHLPHLNPTATSHLHRSPTSTILTIPTVLPQLPSTIITMILLFTAVHQAPQTSNRQLSRLHRDADKLGNRINVLDLGSIPAHREHGLESNREANPPKPLPPPGRVPVLADLGLAPLIPETDSRPAADDRAPVSSIMMITITIMILNFSPRKIACPMPSPSPTRCR